MQICAKSEEIKEEFKPKVLDSILTRIQRHLFFNSFTKLMEGESLIKEEIRKLLDDISTKKHWY